MTVPAAPANFSTLSDLRDLSGNGQSPVFAIRLGVSMYVVKKELSNSTERSAINAVYGIAKQNAGGVDGRAMSRAELTSLSNALSLLAGRNPEAVAAFRQAFNSTPAPRPTVAPIRPMPPGAPPLPPRPQFGSGAKQPPPMPTHAPPNPFDLGRWNIKATSQEQSCWVIMDFATGMLDLKHILANRADKATAARVHMALFEEENLRRLGRIMVTDIFLGNFDRFDYDSRCLRLPLVLAPPVGNEVAMPRVIPNPGNVIFVEKQGKFILSGMDPLDPFGGFRMEMSGSARDLQNQYYGKNLRDLDWRAMAAEVLLKAVAGCLEQHMLGGILESRYCKPEHVQKVVEGMGEGLNKLMAICEQMMHSGRPPADLVERMEILGWKTKAQPKIVMGGHRAPPPLPPRPGTR